jgi:hypothetical protein
MRIILGIFFLLLAAAPSATAKEYFKYTDQNGVVSWLDDKNKTPPPLPKHYKYEDKNGLTFWVNDISKVPDEFKKQATQNNESLIKSTSYTENKREEKAPYTTKININNNQIIVPVTFRNKGRKVKAKMILDTGASVTTLYPGLASKLRLKRNKLARIRTISANGAKTDSLLTKVDYIEVDDKILANAEVVVMPTHSNIGADGLLGNSYLRFFNFTIDYEKQLLRWN